MDHGCPWIDCALGAHPGLTDDHPSNARLLHPIVLLCVDLGSQKDRHWGAPLLQPG